jgi:hypothetical protein
VKNMSRTEHHGNKAKQRKFGKNWRWYQQTPKMWRKMMMIGPARTEQSQAIKKLINGQGEPKKWPDYKKPHEYYW